LTGMPDYLKKLHKAAVGVARRRGDAPSRMAQYHSDNGSAPADTAVAVEGEEQTDACARLLESLRQTLFLF
jgi:hypothetical protein